MNNVAMASLCSMLHVLPCNNQIMVIGKVFGDFCIEEEKIIFHHDDDGDDDDDDDDDDVDDDFDDLFFAGFSKARKVNKRWKSNQCFSSAHPDQQTL